MLSFRIPAWPSWPCLGPLPLPSSLLIFSPPIPIPAHQHSPCPHLELIPSPALSHLHRDTPAPLSPQTVPLKAKCPEQHKPFLGSLLPIPHSSVCGGGHPHAPQTSPAVTQPTHPLPAHTTVNYSTSEKSVCSSLQFMAKSPLGFPQGPQKNGRGVPVLPTERGHPRIWLWPQSRCCAQSLNLGSAAKLGNVLPCGHRHRWRLGHPGTPGSLGGH